MKRNASEAMNSLLAWWRADGPELRDRTARQWFTFAGMAFLIVLVSTSVEPLLIAASLRADPPGSGGLNKVAGILAYVGASVLLIACPALLYTAALGVVCRRKSSADRDR